MRIANRLASEISLIRLQLYASRSIVLRAHSHHSRILGIIWISRDIPYYPHELIKFPCAYCVSASVVYRFSMVMVVVCGVVVVGDLAREFGLIIDQVRAHLCRATSYGRKPK
jgi:hypothetical protein